jgi:L-threonylcarbamoyladenylate synthase
VIAERPTPRILSGPEAIAEGVRSVLSGSLVAFPTETVYGLGADAFRADAVEAVFRLKGRPSGNPLIVHVSGPEMARRVVSHWPAEAERLAGAFWPGPLTLVLPRSSDLPGAVTADGPTVGVRCPDHPVALALIEASGTPLVGPSANPSGRISPTTADHVAAGFAETGLLIIDGGACRAGIESTVLDLMSTPARVLRPGVIGAEAIARVIGRPVVMVGNAGPTDYGLGAVASPGLLGPHYQPRTPVRLARSLSDESPTVSDALIAWSLDTHPAGGVLLRIPPDPAGYAAAIYARLHQADLMDADRILVELPVRPENPDDAAVYDAVLERLRRAAAT